MLPRPYAPIIPLGRGPCGHVSKAGERRRSRSRRRVGEKKKEGVMEWSERRKVAEELF